MFVISDLENPTNHIFEIFEKEFFFENFGGLQLGLGGLKSKNFCTGRLLAVSGIHLWGFCSKKISTRGVPKLNKCREFYKDYNFMIFGEFADRKCAKIFLGTFGKCVNSLRSRFSRVSGARVRFLSEHGSARSSEIYLRLNLFVTFGNLFSRFRNCSSSLVFSFST